MRLFKRKKSLRNWLGDWDASIVGARKEGAERFAATALDPTTLKMGRYDPADASTHCYCGHERGAHRTAFYWDGTCVVEGCKICVGTGYVSGVPA